MTTELIGTVYGYEAFSHKESTVAIDTGKKVVRFVTNEAWRRGERVLVKVERLPDVLDDVLQ